MTGHVVGRADGIEPGRGKAFEVEGERICVFRDGDRLFAVGDACTHIGASLEEGVVEGGAVVCPWHGARFDLASGRPLGPPARGPVRTYPCRVEGDDVVVDV